MENIKHGIWLGETAPSSKPTNIVWTHLHTLEELKRNLTEMESIVSIDSHFKDGNSSTEVLSFLANKFMNEETHPKLQVKSHAKKPQQRFFVARRWREVKWDL